MMITERQIRQIKRYCREDISLIKNYEQAINDKEHKWECHHINELTFTAKELIKQNMYYNRPANEFIFLTVQQHRNIHYTVCASSNSLQIHMKNIQRIGGMTGKNHSKETKLKMSAAKKGKKFTNEHKVKISDSMKGRKRKTFTDEWKRKMSEAAKRRWNK
jgi:prophage tail gpP-like protein